MPHAGELSDSFTSFRGKNVPLIKIEGEKEKLRVFF